MSFANKLTIIRILLIPFFIISIVYYDNRGLEGLRLLALTIFVLSILTDAVDGYIARTRRQKTELGTFLDPVADKLLLISAFVTLAVADRFGVIPIWILVVVISRDVIIVLGLAIIHMVVGRVRIAPNMLGKLATFFQMVVITLVLLRMPYTKLIWAVIWAVVAFFTITSGVVYIVCESRNLNEKV